MPKVHGIDIEQWVTKLNDMDRILLQRIESMEARYINQKATDSTEVGDLTKSVCQLIGDVVDIKHLLEEKK